MRFYHGLLFPLLAWSLNGHGATLHVTSGQDLQQSIDQARPGDTLQLAAGRYVGNIRIDKPLQLQCAAGALLDGGGRHDTLRISAANVTVSGCDIRNWGTDLTAMNAGIFLERSAASARIERNYLHGATFGIWVDASPDVRIHHNRIEGNPDIRSQDRGNGIHLYAVSGADVAFNEVWHTRDGIYIDTSNGNTLRNNELHHLRYGVHYMYSYHNTVSGNYTHHTRTGYALMQSKYLTVTGNRSDQDENYGILMNYITYSKVRDNRITHVRQGRNPTGSRAISGAEGKALFMYNSLFNEITGNLFGNSDLGIHLTAGSENNAIYANTFERNVTQVKYVANRRQDWSQDGQGNFWSDYLGWDRNGDGIGDVPYEPNDGVDKLLWKYPTARILMHSPAVEVLRWAQRQFPVLRSPGVQDSHPLMRPTVTETPL